MATEIHALSAKLELDERERQPSAQTKQRKHFKNKMHLWEFLLELLHDEECRPLITWTKKDRKEFKIIQPECVAQLWGLEHNRKNMTYDKLSRALRQYYEEGIVRKVKGKKSTYKFDKLPYEYNPGVTRRRRTASYRWEISTSPKHGTERGNYSFLTQLNSSGADAGFMPPYAQRSSQLTSLQPKAQIWFPEEERASYNKFERRRVNNWGTFESAALESRNPNPPLFAEEQSTVGNFTPSSLVTHSKSFVTPQSYHSSSGLCAAKRNISYEVSSSLVCANPESTQSTYPLNVEQQNASRNDTPSAAMCAETFPSVTPESSQSSSPLYVVEKNASRNDTPSAAMYEDNSASVTPESFHLRSPLYRYVVEKNTSRNDTPSAAMYEDNSASVTPESFHLRSPLYRYVVEKNTSRNNTPSAAVYADNFASITPKSSHLRSPLYRYVAENNAPRNGLPSDLAYASVYVTGSVPWSTPVFPPVHRIPYLPLMVVPVPCERLPVITSVTGNYSGHPGQDR